MNLKLISINNLSTAVLLAKLTTGDEVWDIVKIEQGTLFKVERNSISATKAIPYQDGYKVNLFSYALYGCTDHYYSENVYHVSNKGEVSTTSTRELFSPLSSQGVCID